MNVPSWVFVFLAGNLLCVISSSLKNEKYIGISKADAQKRNRVRHIYTFKNDFILYTKAKFGIKNFQFAFDSHV
jgi:hypothetical protein